MSFVSFDEGVYATRIRGWPLSKLQTEQVSMTRQQVSASSSIGVIGSAAKLTFGIDLFGTWYENRQLYLAAKKLKLIRAELDRRGEGLHQIIEHHATLELDRQGEDQHQFVKREATLKLGVGVNTIASLSTSTLSSYAVADHGTRAKEGVSLQTREAMGLILEGYQREAALAAADPSYVSEPGMSPGELVGLSLGMTMSQAAELKSTNYLPETVAARVVGVHSGVQSQPITLMELPSTCLRKRSPSERVSCDHCKASFDPDFSSYYRK
jgi:hypothetical protein